MHFYYAFIFVFYICLYDIFIRTYATYVRIYMYMYNVSCVQIQTR